MSRGPQTTLVELFDRAHHDLLRLRKRQYTLETLEAELERLLGTKRTYAVHNDIVYSLILSFIDKNVIDLASWTKALYSGGGFLMKLRADHLGAFPAKRGWPVGKTEDAHVKQHRDEAYAAARARWFPSAGPALKPMDISILQTHFQGSVDALQKDRNENRAHVFEKVGGGKELEIAEMRALYEEAHGMLNDLRLIALGSTFVALDLTNASGETTIAELLEMMLLPEYARDLLRRANASPYDFLDALCTSSRAVGEDFNSKGAVHRELVRRGLAKPSEKEQEPTVRVARVQVEALRTINVNQSPTCASVDPEVLQSLLDLDLIRVVEPEVVKSQTHVLTALGREVLDAAGD